jgi:hypothetical protein
MTHTHDCDKCIFLEEFKTDEKVYDLYFCGNGGPGPTVIARFSSEGKDYLSGLQIAKAFKTREPNYPLVVALKLAKEKGLLKDLCEQCMAEPLAYPGARFCGAACSAANEMHL